MRATSRFLICIASCKDGDQYQDSAADKPDQIQLFPGGLFHSGHNRVEEPDQSADKERNIAVYPVLQYGGQDVSQ